MMRTFGFFACLLGLIRATSATEIEAEQVAFFENEVRPLLVEHCYECHSHESEINGGLALDSMPGWQSGGDSGTTIVPGDPDASLLMKAVRYANPDYEMPPDGKLDDGSIETLRKWIAMGAPDPRGESITADTPESAGRVQVSAEELWSFQPIAKPKPQERL